MTIEETTRLAIDMLRRCEGQIDRLADDIESSEATIETDANKQWQCKRALEAVKALANHVIDGERPPDNNWWRDYFRLSGDHVVLTEEGWEPASIYKSQPELRAEMAASGGFLEELNAPPGGSLLEAAN